MPTQALFSKNRLMLLLHVRQKVVVLAQVRQLESQGSQLSVTTLAM